MIDDDLVDALMDLQHDLGKYLRLPLAMLPADAGPAEVREAAADALLRTRRGPSGVTPAAEIWEAFTDEVGDGLDSAAGYADLQTTVAQALAHAGSVERADPETLRRDLEAVSPAIRVVLREVQGG